MQRRTLLQLGLGGTIALGLAGMAAAQWDSPLKQGHLSPVARGIFLSVGVAILDGSLPTELAARRAALQGLVERIEVLIAGLPGATQDELAELLSVLSLAVGRIAIFGLWSNWQDTSPTRMQQHLQMLRTSNIGVRQQVYHAFHDVVNGAYFSDEKTWAMLGYGGPVKL